MFTQQDVDISAKQAVEAFVQDSVPLSESIAKIAEERELNPNKIARIVEAANHMANHALRKTAEDMRFTFKLASVEDVRNLLDNTGADARAYKKASALSGIGEHEKTAGAQEPEFVRTAADGYNDPDTRLTMFKMALRQIVARANKYATDEESAAKYAEIKIMERREQLADELRPFALEHELDKVAAVIATRYSRPNAEMLLEHVRDIVEPMSKKMHFKAAHESDLAMLRLPEGDEVQANVPRINGNHPMVVALDDIKGLEYDRDRRRATSNCHRMYSNAGVTALYDLNDNDSVHRFVLEQVMRFRDRFKDAPKIAIDGMAEALKNAAEDLLSHLDDAQVEKVGRYMEVDGPEYGFLYAMMKVAQEDPGFGLKLGLAFDKHAQQDLSALLGSSIGNEGIGRSAASLTGGTMTLKGLIDVISKAFTDPRTGVQKAPWSSAVLGPKGAVPEYVAQQYGE